MRETDRPRDDIRVHVNLWFYHFLKHSQLFETENVTNRIGLQFASILQLLHKLKHIYKYIFYKHINII